MQMLTEFRQTFEYRELIKNLVSRDLKVRYKRSILGFLWVMLNPLLIMIILYLVFSQVFDNVPNYAAYIISGIILWNMFSQSTSNSTQSFLLNGTLLKKISVPKIIFPFASVASGLINFCFSLVPLLFIFFLTGTSISLKVFLLPLCILEVLLFVIGIALILSTTVVFFHDIMYIYEVLLMAWMYFSAIFYPVSILPPHLAKLIMYNPMYHYLYVFRGLLYDTTAAGITTHLLYGLFFALLAFFAGTWIYTVNKDRLIFYL